MAKPTRWLVAAVLSLTTIVVPKVCNADGSPEEVAQTHCDFAGKITGSNVRMRLQADLSSPVVELLEDGCYVLIVGADEEFYAVAPPKGTKAYIYRPYVLDGVVEGSHVNVRLEPDVDAPIVTQLNTGDQVHGEVCATNSRWMEIEMPANAHFFVAKEYIEKAGAPELVTKREERRKAASKLLQTVYLNSQQELSKPIAEVAFATIKNEFAKVGQEYPDFPEYVSRAEAVLEMVEQVYEERKAAVAAGAEEEATAAEPATLRELGLEVLEELALAAEGQERLIKIPLTPAVEKGPVDALPLAKPAVERSFVTDKMLAWEPIEESFYQVWALDNEESSKEEFYNEQELDGMTLTGIVATYDRPVRNRPGDFLLLQKNRPVAFLYSTAVNLEEKVGQQVTVRALSRPNHHFAFPAYFVLTVDDEGALAAVD